MHRLIDNKLINLIFQKKFNVVVLFYFKNSKNCRFILNCKIWRQLVNMANKADIYIIDLKFFFELSDALIRQN